MFHIVECLESPYFVPNFFYRTTPLLIIMACFLHHWLMRCVLETGPIQVIYSYSLYVGPSILHVNYI